jgi:hypothetical protein
MLVCMLKASTIPTCVLAIVMNACGSDDRAADGDDATATQGASDGDCTPGTETCECIEGGLCVAGLVCASNLCVDLGATGGNDEGGTEKPMGDDSDGAGDGDGMVDDDGGDPEGSCAGKCLGSSPHLGGVCYCDPTCAFDDACCPDYSEACPGQCFFNSDCAADEVCNSEQQCVYAWGQTYNVCVDLWRDYSTICWDVACGLADVFYELAYAGQLVHVSTTYDDVLQASWTECYPLLINADVTDTTHSNGVWRATFWDRDAASGNDFIYTACFPEDGACSFIPLTFLKAGSAKWSSTDAQPFEVRVRFVAQ